jgi:hypothetical protein
MVYRLTVTGPGETQTLESGGGGTTLTLDAGDWTISVLAYDPANLNSPVGSGSAVITIVTGRNSSVRVPMKVEAAYEAALLDIYLHSEADLRRVGNGLDISNPSRTFYLENDIVLTQPWTPIGDNTTAFRAKFDGQGHSITIRSFGGPILDSFAYLGFFAVVDNTAIKDAVIKYELGAAADMRTGTTYYDGYAGGVTGDARDTTFTNIQVTGNFSVIFDGGSSLNVGGIAGQAGDVTITNCRVSATIGGTSANYLTIGGIAGMISNTSASGGDIIGSSFAGTITGNSPIGNAEAGGIAGYMNDVEITECFAEGRIKAEADSPKVGGIAGIMNSPTAAGINKCYAAGIIESVAATGSYSDTGGIAGRINGGTIENCYAWANVSSSSTYDETAGGIAGTNDGIIFNCYAAGMVQSKGQNPATHVGGIAGNGSGPGTISACMALVSELDGGPSTSTSRPANAIFASSYGTLSGNYSRNDITVTRQTNGSFPSDPGINNKDGEQKLLADFTNSTLYTSATWTFPGVWKFLPAGSGYNYPVLSWQNSPPRNPATVP